MGLGVRDGVRALLLAEGLGAGDALFEVRDEREEMAEVGSRE